MPDMTSTAVRQGRPADTEPAAPDPRVAPETGWLRWLVPVAATAAAGMFLGVLDSSIVGVAYPAIEKELGATSENVQWVSTAYKLAQGIAIPGAVWLCVRYGLSRMYVISLALYAVSSALCAMAPDLTTLILFRILQAIPGGLTPVVCTGIMYRLVPKKLLPIAWGIYAMISVSAPGFAPLLGGYLVEYLNWRFIFIVAVPMSLLGVAAAIAWLAPMPGRKNHPFDIPGFACISVGLFALLLALSKGPQWGWGSYTILILFAVSMNALLLFVVVEFRVRHPLVDMRLFTVKPFVMALLILEVTFTGLTAIISFIPSFLQQVQSMTPSQAGWVMVPQAIAWVLAIPMTAVFWKLVGVRWVTVVGLILMGVPTVLLLRLTVDIPRGELSFLLVIRAIGLGMAMIAMMGSAVSALPPHLIPDGVAFRTMVQRVGSALGFAALSAVVTVDRAQGFADRSRLLDAGAPYHNPQIAQMQGQGPGGLIPLWEALQARAVTQAYSDVYLILGAVTLVCVVIAFTTKWVDPLDTQSTIVEVGT